MHTYIVSAAVVQTERGCVILCSFLPLSQFPFTKVEVIFRGDTHNLKLTLGSGLWASVEVGTVAVEEPGACCQCWEERASTWSGWRTHSDARASHRVGVDRHDSALERSASSSLVKFMMFSAIAALLTRAHDSDSFPCKKVWVSLRIILVLRVNKCYIGTKCCTISSVNGYGNNVNVESMETLQLSSLSPSPGPVCWWWQWDPATKKCM